MKNNIGIFINDISLNGGAEKVTLSLYKALKLTCYPEIKLLSAYRKNEIKESIEDLIILNESNRRLKNTELKKMFSYVLERNHIKKLIIAIIDLKTAKIISSVAKKYKIKLIFVLHNTPFIYLRNFASFEDCLYTPALLFRKICKICFIRFYNYFVLRNLLNLGYFVTVGHECEKELKRIYKKNIKVKTIYNLIDLEQSDSPITMRNNKQVLFLGRFNQQKGVILLLNTWRKMNQLLPEYSLKMIGNGEQLLLIQKLIKTKKIKNIDIINWTDNVKKWYQTSDVCILTSYFEGLPTVFLESLSQNCPIFAVRGNGGLKELINVNTGYYCDSRNSFVVAKKLMNFLLNKNFSFKYEIPLEFNREYILQEWQYLLDDGHDCCSD